MQINNTTSGKTFTRYQVFMIAILAILQFTVILDFMVLSPLGAILLEKLDVSTSKFGFVVSAYAFSAGIAGILTAGFADKFDRKKLLVFFYVGFIIGTLLCAVAPDYHFLLMARIVTGLFGGVIGSISFAIISDLFKMEVRGRVMGFVQMAFAASQILGIPVGLILANHLGWHSPFWMIAGFGTLVGIAVVVYMKPITGHLKLATEKNPFIHLFSTVSKPTYVVAFLATMLLATGGFMLMPFSSAFTLHNIGITNEQLPWVYAISGVFSIFMGPLLGKLSDKIGKFQTFLMGCVITIIMVYIYTHLGVTAIAPVIVINIFMFAGILARSISASALTTAVPGAADRGAFMSINSAVQQVSGGVAAAIAGLVVSQEASGKIVHYNTLGYIVICAVFVSGGMMYFINEIVKKKMGSANAMKVVQDVDLQPV